MPTIFTGDDAPPPENIDLGIVDYKGVLMLIAPVKAYDGAEVRPEGTICCFALEKLSVPGMKLRAEPWVLVPIAEKNGSLCRFASFADALQFGYEQTDLRRTGRVFND
jgi:hypothetical protein